MTKLLFSFTIFLVFCCLFTQPANAQNSIVVSDFKSKYCKVVFSLHNIGQDTFEFDPVVSIKKGKFIPHYYYFASDTVVVDLRTQLEEIKVAGRIDFEYFIDGERRSTIRTLNSNDKIDFSIKQNKGTKVKVVKIIMSESWVLYNN